MPEAMPSEVTVVKDLEARSRVCFIYNAEMVNFWTHGADTSNRPIIRYLHERFRVALRRQGNSLLVRD
jgi:hypothetical protein